LRTQTPNHHPPTHTDNEDNTYPPTQAPPQHTHTDQHIFVFYFLFLDEGYRQYIVHFEERERERERARARERESNFGAKQDQKNLEKKQERAGGKFAKEMVGYFPSYLREEFLQTTDPALLPPLPPAQRSPGYYFVFFYFPLYSYCLNTQYIYIYILYMYTRTYIHMCTHTQTHTHTYSAALP
jgi:hypothetical protein